MFLMLVLLGAGGVYFFFRQAPSIDSSECDRISIEFLANGIAPKWVGGRSDVFGTTRELWQCADAYRVQYPYFVLSAFCIVYITLQTLAIPGPIVLSVLSGALYDPIPAQLLVAFCATTGASLCFTISYFLGNDIVHVLLPSMITRFRKKTQANKHNLFYYLLFLRLTPLLPNWFVNVASPVVGVPLWKFALATFIGLVPANYFHSQTGRTMANLQPGASLSENKSTFMVLMVLQLVPLIPTFFKSKLQKMEEAKFGAAEDSKKQQ